MGSIVFKVVGFLADSRQDKNIRGRNHKDIFKPMHCLSPARFDRLNGLDFEPVGGRRGCRNERGILLYGVPRGTPRLG